MAPIYTFSTPSGAKRELFFSMDDAPSIGETVEVGGIELVRQVDKVQICAHQDTHFVSHSLTRNHPDAPRVDKNGKPCFQSKKEVDEFVSKQEGGIVWD